MSTRNVFSLRNKKKYPKIITKYSSLTTPDIGCELEDESHAALSPIFCRKL